MYREWPFFRALLDNAQMILAKADMVIASFGVTPERAKAVTFTDLVYGEQQIDPNEIEDFDQIYLQATWLKSFDAKGQPLLYLSAFGSDGVMTIASMVPSIRGSSPSTNPTRWSAAATGPRSRSPSTRDAGSAGRSDRGAGARRARPGSPCRTGTSATSRAGSPARSTRCRAASPRPSACSS